MGLVVKDREEAYVLDNADGTAICEGRIRTIIGKPELSERTGRGGRHSTKQISFGTALKDAGGILRTPSF